MRNVDANTPQSAPPSLVPWPPILLVGTFAAALAMEWIHPLPWPGVDDLPARIVGLAIGALGIALMIWSVVTMIRARTNIMPHRSADHLVTTGPFHRFRNPIYLADTMILLGMAEVTKNIWFAVGALIFALAVTWLAIIPEERHLEARFGDLYREYKARSKRWL